MAINDIPPQRMKTPTADRAEKEIPKGVAGQVAVTKIDPKRYREVRRFFRKVTLHVIWWDIILNRPGLRRFRTPLTLRWKKLAEEFRTLALEMGGVLIKLGQFISTRVDLFPPVVTNTLTDLQDEVPPEPSADIIALIEADFKRPISEIFSWFAAQAMGSASLAQVHQARLISGEDIVVKVLRPGIRVKVETDLLAFTQALQRLKYYKPISKQIDLDWLAEEFITITRKELDFEAEGRNIERFAQIFAADPQVCVPQVYWAYTAANTLAMENVAYIRIDDLDGIEAAGIDRKAVAKKLFELYLQQFFITHFVHADPHAGNLFVKPLPQAFEVSRDGKNGDGFRPGDPVPYQANRPFQLVFVDFGMVVSTPERLRAILPEYAIGVGTRDARRIVQFYIDGGILVPEKETDIALMEEITEIILERYEGTLLGQFKGIDLIEYNKFFISEYREFLEGLPFQMQADLLFVFRAMGILAGMTVKLDPEFDLWSLTNPFARRLSEEDLQYTWQYWQREATRLGQIFYRLPERLDDVLGRAQKGKLMLKMILANESQKDLSQLKRLVGRLIWVVAAVGLLISGVIWQVGNLMVKVVAQAEWQGNNFGVWLIVLAAISFLWGIVKKG